MSINGIHALLCNWYDAKMLYVPIYISIIKHNSQVVLLWLCFEINQPEIGSFFFLLFDRCKTNILIYSNLFIDFHRYNLLLPHRFQRMPVCVYIAVFNAIRVRTPLATRCFPSRRRSWIVITIMAEEKSKAPMNHIIYRCSNAYSCNAHKRLSSSHQKWANKIKSFARWEFHLPRVLT